MVAVYSRRQLRYLEVMGIPAWAHRCSEQNPLTASPSDSTQRSADSGQSSTTCDSVDDFPRWIFNAPLARSARSELLEGDANAHLLVIEDALPGVEGYGVVGQRPFAGPPSRMFDAMLKAIDLTRRKTLLATLAPPTGAAGSSTDSLATISALSLRAVLYYSQPAAQHGLSDFDSLRDREHVLPNGVPCIVSYHPAYLMDNNHLKRAAWSDLKRVRQLLD
ncbi:MAG: hypothetical protein KTR32_05840 [Granulosicoccus sp.]|nr:hypothetical protein [Granulosicoccus sp.]